MEDMNDSPLRKYPKRNRKQVKYFDESVYSVELTPRPRKSAKNKVLTDDSSYSEKDSSNDKENDEIEEEGEEVISEYELQRLKNLEENRRMMIELGLVDPSKPKPKPKPKPKKPSGKAPIKQISEPIKRSLRLLNRSSPTIPDSPIIFDGSPQNTSAEDDEITRIEEDSLPMNEDGTITDFLDKLKTTLSQKSSQSSDASSIDSLIDDMRSLDLAGHNKMTKNRTASACVHKMESKLLIVSGSKNGELALWDVNEDKNVTFQPHVLSVHCVSVSTVDDTKLFTTSLDGSVRLADLHKSVIDRVYETDESLRKCHLTWHEQVDQDTLLVAHGIGDVGMIDLRTKNVEQWFHCHSRSVRTVQLHPIQRQYFLTSSGLGESKIFDLRAKNKSIEDFVGELSIDFANRTKKGLTSAFFSPDGNKAVTTCNDDRIRIYNTSDLAQPKEVRSVLHDNHTGRWLTPFKTVWHSQSSDLLFVGSMLMPRRIQMYNGTAHLLKEIKHEELTTVVPVISVHPTLPVVVGCNSSGRAHVFTTPQYFTYFSNNNEF